MDGACRITTISSPELTPRNSSVRELTKVSSRPGFEHDHGRLLAVVTNGTRALVMVLDEPGDAGEHTTDPMATGQQGGYVLGNGQHDTYENRDTVPLRQALVLVEHLVNHGRPPAGVNWHVDRFDVAVNWVKPANANR